jgi:PAS domain S-box-containing protein
VATVVFVGFIYKLSVDSKKIEEKLASAEEIKGDLDTVQDCVLQSAKTLFQFELTGNRKYADDLAANENNTLEKLKDLRPLLQPPKDRPPTEQEQAALASLDRLDKLFPEVKEVCDLSVDDLNNGRKVDAMRRLSSLKSHVNKLSDEVAIIAEQADSIKAQAPQLTRDIRARMESSCLIGLSLTIAAAIAAAVIATVQFNRSTTNRLNILMDNINRLGSHKQLNPPIKGDDEVAELDHVFRDMAQELEAATEKERSMIENMPIGLILLNQKGQIQRINPAVERMFHFSESELLGSGIDILFAQPASAPEAESSMERLSRRALMKVAEGEIVKKNGESMPVEYSLTPYSISSDAAFLYLLVVGDITQRKEVERLKREFLQMISHDLRTPLASIQVFLNLLSDGSYGQLTEKGQGKAEVADRNASRLINLVNDLLDIEKMESGQLKLSSEVVPISAVIDRSCDSVRAYAEQQGITIESMSDQAEVFADADRLVQVMVNLLGNAIKFSPKDSTVKVSVDKSSVEWIGVRVIDQGRGVPENMREAVFQRFKQVELKDATEKKGSGLGLAICKVIIEQHGGKIGVDNNPEGGSTFWFKLPLVRQISIADKQAKDSIQLRKPQVQAS